MSLFGVQSFNKYVLGHRGTVAVVIDVVDILVVVVVVVVVVYHYLFFFPLRFSPRYLQLRSYFGSLLWDQWLLSVADGMCSIPLLFQGVCWVTFINLPKDSASFEL